jgi:hypothetical protein
MAGNMNLPPMGQMRESNIWKIGTPCSSCPSGYTRCNAGLCSATTSSTKIVSVAPTTTTTTPTPIRTCAADTVNKPTNGNIGTCGYNTNVGYSCTQVCNTGYTLTSGSLSRQCQSTGVWSSTTAVCSPVTCAGDTSTKPTNGNAGTCGTSKTYGQTCSMACNSGYALTSGSLSRTCGSSGTFSSASALCTAPFSAPTSSPTDAPSTGTYCNSGPLETDDTEFGAVTLVGNSDRITDNNGCPGQVGPLDLTALSATVTQGTRYTLTLERTSCGEFYVAIIGAWIDWNQNRLWETSELLFPFSQQIGTMSFSFTVPSNARIGRTRMRLQVQEIGSVSTSTIDPCAMFQWGDTKDYSIDVAGATAALEGSVVGMITAEGICYPDGIEPVNGGLGSCAGISRIGLPCTQTCNNGFTLRDGTSLQRNCTESGYAISTAICE